MNDFPKYMTIKINMMSLYKDFSHHDQDLLVLKRNREPIFYIALRVGDRQETKSGSISFQAGIQIGFFDNELKRWQTIESSKNCFSNWANYILRISFEMNDEKELNFISYSDGMEILKGTFDIEKTDLRYEDISIWYKDSVDLDFSEDVILTKKISDIKEDIGIDSLMGLLSEIKETSIDDLKNYYYFKNIIKKYSSRSYIQDEDEFSRSLCSVSKYDIKKISEIGVFKGGSLAIMIAYFKRINPFFEEGIGIDTCCFIPYLSTLKKEIPIRIITGNSNENISICSDLCHIDAAHDSLNVKNDYVNMGMKSKICLFHDISMPSVSNAISNILDVFEYDKYIEVFSHDGKKYGTGILVK